MRSEYSIISTRHEPKAIVPFLSPRTSAEWCSHARPYCGRPAKLQGACCLRLRPVEQLHPPLREARTLVSLESCEVGCAVVPATLQIVA